MSFSNGIEIPDYVIEGKHRNDDDDLTVSFSQERLWFLQEMNPDNIAYNIPLAIRLIGELDIPKLERSFSKLITRHETMRVIFRNVNGKPYQELLPFQPFSIMVDDLCSIDMHEREKRAKEIVTKIASTPFDLSTGPLYRIRLLKIRDNEFILVLVMHHIISDGWSTNILINEIAKMYETDEQYWDEVLPELPVSYSDFATWQRDKYEQGGYKGELEYWKQSLGASTFSLSLPYDYPKASISTYEGTVERFQISRVLSNKIKEMSKNAGVSVYSILISAYYLLLYRYTNQKELVLGTPVANRNHLETESLIGCFMNTIPIKLEINGNISVEEFIKSVSKLFLNVYEMQEVPFEKIVDMLQLERTLAQSAIFETMFIFQNQHEDVTEIANLEIQPYPIQVNASKFDLSLSAMEVDGEYDLLFEYRTELFTPDTMKQIARSYETILESMMTHPEFLVRDVNYLHNKDRIIPIKRRLVKSKQHDLIHERLERQALKYPHLIAVIDRDRSITYKELNEKSNQLARWIRKNGVSNERKVLIQLDSSISFIMATLAVLKAGGAYIPIDVEHSAKRTTHIIEDSKSNYMITTNKIMDRNGSHNSSMHYFMLDEEKYLNESVEPISSINISPDQTAYIIYTSGSTGKPKGVLNTHYNVTRLFESTKENFSFDSTDHWTLFHSIAFDFSVWEIWGALFNGGKLYIVPKEIKHQPVKFYKYIQVNNITVLNQTPSAFKELIQLVDDGPYSLSLKYVIFGGEPLDYQSLLPWFNHYGEQVKLINMYGITETTVHVTYREIKPSDVKGGQRSFIGKPLHDLNVYILNEDFLMTPIGVPGEMFVSGAGLAQGYNNRPSLTALQYVPNPFSRHGERLYRTGDIAKRTIDGDIEYLGRIDDQVKVKGHRIELGEIKSAILEETTVEDCVVLVGNNYRNENELAAFVIFKNNKNVDEYMKDLRHQIIEKLPRYMYPAHIIPIDSIPINVNGKVAKDKLLALRETENKEENEEIMTEMEIGLVKVWEKVLGREGIGVSDNFFSLGGDSIRSVQVISELQEIGQHADIKSLFQYQTVKELAEYLERNSDSLDLYTPVKPFDLISKEDRKAINVTEVEDAYPLTTLQLGMLFHMEQNPNQPIYHNIDSVLLEGPFDSVLFSKAVEQIVEDNTMLRTSFDMQSYTVPLQLVHKKAILPIGYEDITDLSTVEQEKVIDSYIRKKKEVKFDLTKPSLLEFFIHKRSHNTFQFTLTECHLIFDGWSLTSTLGEIFELYFLLTENSEYKKEKEKDEVSFVDFVKLEQEVVHSKTQKEFWEKYLEDCQLIKFDYLQKFDQKSVDIGRRIVTLSPDLSDRLKELAKELKVTIKSVVLAAHMKALQIVSGQSDIVTGLVSNGRLEVKGGDKVKGLFLNTIPFRKRIEQATWSDLIQQTFDLEEQVLPYRRYPLSEIQNIVGQSPLFETAFNYVHFHSMDHLFKTNRLKLVDFNKNSANDTHFSLMANFAVHPPRYDIQLTLAFNENMFSTEQMASIANIYENVLEKIAYEPLNHHSNESFLPKEEYHSVIWNWNNTDHYYSDHNSTVQQLIEREVNKYPDQTALVFESEEMSYRELDNNASKVAQFLKNEGIGHNAFIGIYIERSLDMMIGLLGILKAGCAYVPLDPSYPSERIQYMITDSGIECILTIDKLKEGLQNLGISEGTKVFHISEVVDSQPLETKSSRLRSEGSEYDIAYMIYTSGSTGKPKGVMVPQQGIVNRLLWMQEEYKITKEDRILQKTPLSFDVSLWELFLPLMSGSTLVIAKPEGHKDSDYLVDIIQKENITTLHFVPTLLHEFLNNEHVSRCSSIKRVICSGEALTRELKNQFYEKLTAELHNLYGPTEASVDVTSYACEVDDENVWIGKPIANIQLYVLNDELQPVGIGRIGELFISGIGLATGYANKPYLTAETFIPNPYSKVNGSRMYRTGDLVRLLPDGNFDYLGRKDSQVKIRGVRIELKEIESIIRQHKAVRETVVLLVDSEDDPNDLLVSYIVTKEQENLSVSNIQQEISNYLPNNMQPDRFVFLDNLPITPNGKIDRKSLPKPSRERPKLDVPYVSPRNPEEEEMVSIFIEVLKIEHVGVLDNFFELGGNSLSSVLLINRVEKRMGKKLPINFVFDYPTIETFVDAMKQYQEN